MTDLEKIRKEHAMRPVEVDVQSVEKRFPADDLVAPEPQCCEPGCEHQVFRGQPRCKEHHLEWCAAREVEAQKI